MSQQILYLPHKIPLAGFLHLPTLVSDGFLQIRHGFLILPLSDIVVGIGIIPVVYGTEIHRVTAHIAYHVLGIIPPPQLCVAFCQPRPCQSASHGIAQIQAGHIRECGSSLFKLPHLEFGLPHHQPRLPEKWVILLAFLLDAMALDGFLHLLDGALIVRLAQVATCLVGYGIEWQQLCIVVLVAFFLLQIAFDKGLMPIIIGIITGIKSVPEARLGGILLRRTACYRRSDSHNHQYVLRLTPHYLPSSSSLLSDSVSCTDPRRQQYM